MEMAGSGARRRLKEVAETAERQSGRSGRRVPPLPAAVGRYTHCSSSVQTARAKVMPVGNRAPNSSLRREV